MPFLTEEIWHQLQGQTLDLVVSPWPTLQPYKASLNEEFLMIQTLVSKLRETRNHLQKSPKETLEAAYEEGGDMVALFENPGKKQLIEKLANVRLNDAQFSTEGYQKTSFLVSTQKIHILLPQGVIDLEEELKKLEEELAYQRGFVDSIDKKLSNEKFVSGAPAAVVDKEKKKREDGLQRIEALLSNIKNLK
jgi:valyl-tRNA synthetase